MYRTLYVALWIIFGQAFIQVKNSVRNRLINPGKSRKISLLQYPHSKTHTISTNTSPYVKKNIQEKLTSNLMPKKQTKKSNMKNDKSKAKSLEKKSIPQGGRGELKAMHALHQPYTVHTRLLLLLWFLFHL